MIARNSSIIIFICLLVQPLYSASGNKALHVVLRSIGHKLLLSGGDSVSRVLPIKIKKEGTYILSFDNQINISPDSLTRITEHELKKIGIRDFVAELKECHSNEIYLSFLYSQSMDSITPCSGRNLPTGCYTVEISLLKQNHFGWIIWMLIPVFLVPMMYVYYQKRKAHAPGNQDDYEMVSLGSYQFDYPKKILRYEGKNQNLTEKEAKLLELLIRGLHETQNRDYLTKEIWGDQGLLVVSKNLDVLVSKLRKKLDLDASVKVTNVHGIGYKLEVSN